MDANLLTLLFWSLLILGFVFVFRAIKRQTPPGGAVAPFVPPEDPLGSAPGQENTFFEEIEDLRSQRKKDNQEEVKRIEAELDEQFGKDLQLKSRVSAEVERVGLDKALRILWDELAHYPVWSKSEDNTKGDALKIEDVQVEDTNEKGEKPISFGFEGVRYRITLVERFGYEGNTIADFTLYEDGEEVFALESSEEYEEYGSSYHTWDIKAFRRRGQWAKLLIRAQAACDLYREKQSAKIPYSQAGCIKKRFPEW